MGRITIGPTSWKIQDTALGGFVQGGYLICKSGGVGWIVAPASTEVSRAWASQSDAVTLAQASAACGDWFVPTFPQLQNPGYTCRTYWDSYSSASYWSSTTATFPNNSYACGVNFSDGNTFNSLKTGTACVRAFRCVTY